MAEKALNMGEVNIERVYSSMCLQEGDEMYSLITSQTPFILIYIL